MSWGDATNGNTWEHPVLQWCYAISPLDDSPPLPRPSNLVGSPYVGIIAHQAGVFGLSASRLAIMPFDTEAESFELRGKIWFERTDAHSAGIDIYLAPLGTGSAITGAPEIRLDVNANSTGLMNMALTMDNGSGSTTVTSSSIASKVAQFLDVVIRGTKATNSVQVWLGDNLLYLASTTPDGVVSGLMSLSDPVLRLDTQASGPNTTSPYTCAFDDFRMVEFTAIRPPTDSGTPNYGHVCQTFTAPGQQITLGSMFAPGSCEVWLNGIYLTGFTEDTGTNSIDLGFVPHSSAVVRVCYLAVGPWV